MEKKCICDSGSRCKKWNRILDTEVCIRIRNIAIIVKVCLKNFFLTGLYVEYNADTKGTVAPEYTILKVV
jgi:hypothetical protein